MCHIPQTGWYKIFNMLVYFKIIAKLKLLLIIENEQ